MAKPADDAPLIERVLAYAIMLLIGVSVISFLAVLIAGLNGVEREDFTTDLWPLLTWVSYVGLPVGLALLITLLIINMRRRARQNGTT
jgi:TRAP-type C4-dicarboxylate transport system permease small subunit